MGKDEVEDLSRDGSVGFEFGRFIDRRHPDTFAFVVFTNIRNT